MSITSMKWVRSSGSMTIAVRPPAKAIHSGCRTVTRPPSAKITENGRNGAAWMACSRFAPTPWSPDRLNSLEGGREGRPEAGS